MPRAGWGRLGVNTTDPTNDDKPVILLSTSDERTRRVLEGEVVRRYGGNDVPGDGAGERPPLPLETSLPGVFAVGDVRQGSVKRIASAVGSGAIAAQYLHHYLDEVRRGAVSG